MILISPTPNIKEFTTAMNDINTVLAALLCTKLGADKEHKAVSPANWHKLMRSLYRKGIENPSALLHMDEAMLKNIDGIDGRLCKSVVSLCKSYDNAAASMEKLNADGIYAIGMDSEYYPERIVKAREKDAPPIFYIYGNKELLKGRMISVTGARNPQSESENFARRCGIAIADNNYTLVSGGAIGCDTIAQNAASGCGGSCVIFPAAPMYMTLKNQKFRHLCQSGRMCLVSDVNPYFDYSKAAVLRRNKYIYICSDASFVCESGNGVGGTYRGALEYLQNGGNNVYVFKNDKLLGNRLLCENGAANCEIDEISRKISDIIGK